MISLNMKYLGIIGVVDYLYNTAIRFEEEGEKKEECI